MDGEAPARLILFYFVAARCDNISRDQKNRFQAVVRAKKSGVRYVLGVRAFFTSYNMMEKKSVETMLLPEVQTSPDLVF